MSHYFENDQNVKHHRMLHDVKIKEQNYQFWTDHGVFSGKGLDFGTRSLLETIPVAKMTGDILDFGCGYGPIGIFLARNTDANIDMIDINERSVQLAIDNAKQNKVTPHIWTSDQYQNIHKKYDYIITNPPIRVGKEILYQILINARKYLKMGGSLWFVIHKDQGAKSVMRDLGLYYQISLINKNKGFYIICGQAIDNLKIEC